ncbi:MAG: hypothetical protein E6J34_06105 [Chloroflexi bacterium]|jgi:hypothetical protein|nr:MAG: hypothetical protein E6J34_06105 [Chloroflexota bacterium]
MSRKDTDKDPERPHYYSQFWLDVAAGRRIIGTPKTNEEMEAAEGDALEPVSLRKTTGRAQDENRSHADGQAEKIVHPVAEPITTLEDAFESDEDGEPITDDDEALDLRNIKETDIPDMQLDPVNQQEDEFFDDEEDSDDAEFAEDADPADDAEFTEDAERSDDVGWGGRGRKKTKPSRTVKPPKKPRRDPRRNY